MVATTAWLTSPLAAAASVPWPNTAPTDVRVAPARVAEDQPAGTTVGRIVVRDPDRGDRHDVELLRGRDSFRLQGRRLVTTRPLDREVEPVITIRLRVTDRSGARLVREVAIRVAGRDDPPTAVDDVATLAEDAGRTTLRVRSNDPDPDRGAKRIESVGPAAHGRTDVGSRGARVGYTPDPDWCGEDAFSYALRPGGSTAQVLVTVTCEQDAPVAIDDTVAGVEDTVLQLPLSGAGSLAANDTDADGDALEVTGVSDAVNGTVAIVDGTVRFTPSGDTCSPSAGGFRYTVGDGHGGEDTGEVTVTLACVDDGPEIRPDTATVAEDSAATTIPVLANDSAGDGPSVSVATVTQPPNGAAAVAGGGSRVTYVPDADYCGTDVFAYTTNVGRTAAVTVTVTCVQDAPVAVDQAFDAIGNTTLVVDDPTDAAPDPAGLEKVLAFDLLATASDADQGDTLAVDAVTDQATTGGGRVTIEADGDVVYVPERGCGDVTDSFDYVVTDGTATDTATVTITLDDCVWYVDGSAPTPAPALAGTARAPYPSLDDLAGGVDPDAPGDRIFVASGSYTSAVRFPLEPDQQLSTSRSGLTVGADVLLARDPGRAPTTIIGGLAPSTDNTVQGLDLGAASGHAVEGSSVGSFTMNTTTSGGIVNPDGALSIGGTGNVLDVELDLVESTAGGLEVRGASGSVVIEDGTLRDTSVVQVVKIEDSTLDLDVGADVDGTNPVWIAASPSGARSFTGQVTGESVVLALSPASTTRFEGGLNLSTDLSTALSAFEAGTIAVIDPPGPATNTLDADTTAALYVDSTTIDTDGLTFERISATGGSVGVGLVDTGDAGGLTVTGVAGGECSDPADACAGGTIEDSFAQGVQLEDVGGEVSLAQMRVQDSVDIGISMVGSTRLVVDEMSVADNGRVGLAQGALDGASELTVTDSTFSGHSEAAVWTATRFTGAVDVRLDGVRMTSNPGSGLVATADEDSELDLTVRDTTVDDPLDVSDPDLAQVNLEVAGDSTTRALFDGLTLTDSNDSGLYAVATEDAVLDATVRRSTVRDPAVSGIWVRSSAYAEPRVLIDSTIVRGYDQRGVVLEHGTINAPGDTPDPASWTVTRSHLFDAGSGTPAGLVLALGGTGAAGTACADIGGSGVENDLGDAGRPGLTDVLVPLLPGSSLALRGLLADVFDTLASRNLGSIQVTRTGTGSVSGTVGACPQPQLPAP